MRRFVRYSPLGKTRQVKLHYGMNLHSRDAEVIDESLHGFGLRLPDCSGLEIGQRVTIENYKGRFQANIIRIELSREGGFAVGLEFPN